MLARGRAFALGVAQWLPPGEAPAAAARIDYPGGVLGWLIGGGGLLVAAVVWLRDRGRPAVERRMLPPSPLVHRLGRLLAAIEGVRGAAEELRAADLWLCAPPQGSIAYEGDPEVEQVAGGMIGPGRQRFVELSAAIEAVGPDDRRELAGMGFDLDRLRSALVPAGEPERWRAQLLRTFEILEDALGRANDPYR